MHTPEACEGANAILVGTQPVLLGCVAACLDQAGYSYGVVASHRAAGIPGLSNALDIVGVPPIVINQPEPGFFADLSGFARALSADVVIATDLPAMRSLSANVNQIAIRALFPTPDLEQLDRVDNKWTFHELLNSCAVPGPRTVLLYNADDPAAEHVGFPAIIKPLALAGGIGVHRVNSRNELHERMANWPAMQIPALLQEYIPGSDIDVSLLASDGRVVAWTVQRWVDETSLAFEPDDQALAFAERIVAATGFNGVAHIDMRRDERDGSLRVIECNPRFWGTLEGSMAAGVNFPHLGVRIALGQPVQPVEPRTVHWKGRAFDAAGRLGPRGLVQSAGDWYS